MIDWQTLTSVTSIDQQSQLRDNNTSIPSQIEMIILILSCSIQIFFVSQKLYITFCLDFMESGRGCSKGTIVRNYPANKITVGHDSMVFSPLCSGSDIFPLMTLTASEGNGADYIEWISQETPITIQTYLYHPSTHQPYPPRYQDTLQLSHIIKINKSWSEKVSTEQSVWTQTRGVV